MDVFSTKLDDLRNTLVLGLSSEIHALSDALSTGVSELAIAVGSGGSAISAEYLRVCRNTLGSSPTLVQTPMEFVFGSEALVSAQIFLFSAGGNNPDIVAAFEASTQRCAHAIHVVTNSAAGELAERCIASRRAVLHVLPVADPKDGFLATHSLASAICSLLAASDLISNRAGRAALSDKFLRAADEILSKQARGALTERFASLHPNDTILLLNDPRLAPVGLFIETSVWEAGLCGIQRTDHRNFAHGRHVWLERRPAEAMLISLTGFESRAIWEAIDRSVPPSIRRLAIDFGNCGRFENALGVLRALTVVEALGRATSIDPGKPGAGPFASNIYESPSLKDLSERLPAAVRHKRASMLCDDDLEVGKADLTQNLAALKTRFSSGRFAGVVLDYDGTIVSDEERYNLPSAAIIAELKRLLDERVPIAIATGRGGSVGEKLREALPPKYHAGILVGYYNGAYIRTLDIDIRTDPPLPHPTITNLLAWLDRNLDLVKDSCGVRRGPVQLTLELSALTNVSEFRRRFSSELGPAAGAQISQSAHTVDITPTEACKTSVVRALAQLAGASAEAILCIGDSGGPLGNDYVMLGMPFGISVDQVCGRADVGWSFFGLSKTGPQALLHILQSLRRGPDKLLKLDVDVFSKTLA
jgi:hydroxymethylpyrimidine pyrophosphatase-like HAD family hydrolase